MRAFDEVLPGLAGRITVMAEGHAKNYWRNDRAQRTSAILAQVLSFLLLAGIIVGGIWLVSEGHSGWGFASILTAAGSIFGLRGLRR